jgi:hypothetical protein
MPPHDDLAAYGRREVTVLLTVPFSRLTLQPVAGARQGKIVLFLAARDSTGRSLRMRRIAIPVHVADGELAAALRKTAAYRLKLELPPGAAILALGVRAELGGAESTVAARYTAGALATARATGPPAPPGGR